MNDLTREWIEKAEADLATARREAAVIDRPNWDAVCFHAQQCAEKYLKAVLQESGLRVPRTHDLVALLTLTLPIAPTWQLLEADLLSLTAYAVEFRYPGFSADEADARRALAIAEVVCDRVMEHLAPP